jgi:hypothetical protein
MKPLNKSKIREIGKREINRKSEKGVRRVKKRLRACLKIRRRRGAGDLLIFRQALSSRHCLRGREAVR